MLISKGQFIRYLNKYKECRQEQNRFHEDLRKYFDSPVCNYLQSAISTMEEMLVTFAECKHEDNIFYWWTEEVNKDNRYITVRDRHGNKTQYDVLSAEGLYNYLYDTYHHDD